MWNRRNAVLLLPKVVTKILGNLGRKTIEESSN
jgi:hypothetical protein